MPIRKKPSGVVQGTLDMLILKTLDLEPLHGYGIGLRLHQIWFGFSVLALGTIIALLPERAFAFARVTAPRAGATATATTVLLVVGLTLLGPGTARAQPDQLQGAVQEADEATPLEIDLRRSLVCMCGAASCGKKLLAECMCAEAVRLRAEIKGLVAEGLTHDEVLRFYIDKHGSQEPLAAPLDEGFNRQEGARDGDLGDDEPVTEPREQRRKKR